MAIGRRPMAAARPAQSPRACRDLQARCRLLVVVVALARRRDLDPALHRAVRAFLHHREVDHGAGREVGRAAPGTRTRRTTRRAGCRRSMRSPSRPRRSACRNSRSSGHTCPRSWPVASRASASAWRRSRLRESSPDSDPWACPRSRAASAERPCRCCWPAPRGFEGHMGEGRRPAPSVSRPPSKMVLA